MTLSRRVVAVLLFVLFVVSFLTRAYYPISRPSQWMRRAQRYNIAVDTGDWASTYQSRHPGVTTMMVGGLALRIFDSVAGTPAEKIFDWATPPYTNQFGRWMAAGVMGLALVLAGLLVVVVLALRKLGGWPLALASGGLMTFAPFFLAQTQAFHVDGMLSTLMLLSALLVLIYAQTGQKRYLLLSGFVGGLSIISKTPGAFMVPYTGLVLLVRLAARLWPQWNSQTGWRVRWLLAETWRELLLPGLIWLVMAALAFGVWPAMWVDPLKPLSKMFLGVADHVANPHYKPRFFAGKVILEEHPSATFYPVTMAFNSSFPTVSLLIVALLLYTVGRKRGIDLPVPPMVFWLLVAYVFFFVVQMSIGARQVDRYVLPALVMLDLLAAVGLAGAVRLLREALEKSRPLLARALPPALIGLAVVLQALVALPFMPDYGAHHNYLLGGNATASKMIEVMGQNEGVIYVADYLNTDLAGKVSDVRVTSPAHKTLKQYYNGNIGRGIIARSQYYLFTFSTMQRNDRPEQWQEAWDEFHAEGKQPELVVEYDGVPFLWLYPEHETDRQVIIRRGWAGFVGVAWVWTVSLIAVVLWALRRARPGERGITTP